MLCTERNWEEEVLADFSGTVATFIFYSSSGRFRAMDSLFPEFSDN
jgi:hypothetical protein